MGTNNATEAELALLHLADIRPVYSARTEAQLYSILSSLNRSNATVMLTDNITLNTEPWNSMPITVTSGQVVVLKADLTSAPNVTRGIPGLLSSGAIVLSLNDTPACFELSQDATLAFDGVVITQQPSPDAYVASKASAGGIVYPPDFPLFPAVLCDSRCTVMTANTSLQIVTDSCSQAVLNTLIFQRNYNLIASAEVGFVDIPDSTMVYSTGAGTFRLPLVNSSTLTRRGASYILRWILGPTVNECLVDPFVDNSGGDESNALPSWAIAVIVILSVLATTAVAVLLAVFIRRRRHKARASEGRRSVYIVPPPSYPKSSSAPGSMSSLEQGEASGIAPSTALTAAVVAAAGRAVAGAPVNEETADALIAALPTATEDLELLGPASNQGWEAQSEAADVWRARWRGSPVVVRVVRSVDRARVLAQEADIILSISHPNLLSVYLICRAGHHQLAKLGGDEQTTLSGDSGEEGATSAPAGTAVVVLVVMEICDRGSLEEYSKGARSTRDVHPRESSDLLVDERVVRLLIDLASALDYLHSCGIVHGHVCSSDACIISAPGTKRGYRAKLSYLGSNAVAVQSGRYAAPECLSGPGPVPPTTEIDCYGFGLLVWDSWMATLIRSGIPRPDTPSQGQRRAPIFPTPFPPDLARLATECWNTNPLRRPRSGQILQQLRGALFVAIRNRGAQAGIETSTI